MSLTASWESLTTSWAERLDKIWVVVKKEEITLERENRGPEVVEWLAGR